MEPVRLALVALVVLAVVVPTALVPQTATGNVYSVPQVLRAFRAEGLPLHRAAGERPSFGQKFSGSPGEPLSVYVITPSGTQLVAFGWTGYPPKFAARGNVQVVWTTSQGPGDEGTRIHAALGALSRR